MGLAFLNKKSWHTGSFQNIEKVWIAEQKKKELDRHQAELGKKLKEERHMEELKRLQVEAGLIPASHLNRMDWMYQGANKQYEKKNEDYLLGKKITEKDLIQTDSGKKPPFVPTYKEEIGNVKNEEFTKLHEDPMYLITQEEMKRKQEIIDNPIKMRDILTELEKMNEKKHKHHKKKKDKKEKKHKKDKKNKKEKKKKESSSSRSRSRSKEKSSKSEPSKQSKFYEDYLKKRLGSILVKDEHGILKPDFGLHKRKHKGESVREGKEITAEQRDELVNKMKDEAKKIHEHKLHQHKNDFEDKNQQNNPEFLRNMKKELYNSEKNINDLGDRVGRNKNYYSRIGEDSNTFKRK